MESFQKWNYRVVMQIEIIPKMERELQILVNEQGVYRSF
jgi:hypothetical protein